MIINFIINICNTLEILQTFELGSSLYLGGMLMHSNGHVYCIHANILYVFFDGDLSNFTKSSIPSSLNGNAIQTNDIFYIYNNFPKHIMECYIISNF